VQAFSLNALASPVNGAGAAGAPTNNKAPERGFVGSGRWV